MRRQQGAQNLLCAYLAGAVLIGLLGNALVGAWWLDPMVGLLIAGLAVYEGRSSNGVDFVRSRVYATVKCTKPPALW